MIVPRVLMVCSQFPPIYGGAGAQSALLSKQLAARGWDVEVVTLDQDGLGSQQVDGYRVTRTTRMRPGGALRGAITTLALSLKAVTRVFASRPSIVHIHGIYWWTILPVIAGRLTGAKTVIKSTRDGEDDPYTVVSRRIRGLPIGWIYGTSVRLANAIVVLNENALTSAERAGVLGKTHILHNGVDTDLFTRTDHRRNTARAKFSLRHDDRVVTFVGYLVEHKGVLDLIEAFRQMGHGPDLQLWLVGPSAGFYRELTSAVPSAIERLRAEGFDVREFGHLDRAELPDIYWATDVYTLPSYAEGMPNSLAEALVAGCQVVATRIPGVIDIMDDANGWLVPPGDTAALANGLREALQGEARDPSAAAEALGIASVADRYVDLYDRLSNRTAAIEMTTS